MHTKLQTRPQTFLHIDVTMKLDLYGLHEGMFHRKLLIDAGGEQA